MTTQLTAWQQQNPNLVERGITEAAWSTIRNSLFPGASDASALMAWDYCKARGLDIMLKPVHLVEMKVKVVTPPPANRPNDKPKTTYVKRDVVLPGIGLYRVQASRSGSYAGIDRPIYGEMQERTLTVAYNDEQGFQQSRTETYSFPEYCEITVYKMIDGQRCAFTALEYWEENYATKGYQSEEPNDMWRRRSRGQLAKCTEAQALRKAWPELLGSEPTFEELDGKDWVVNARDITPQGGIDPESEGPQPLREAAPIDGDFQAADETPQQEPQKPADKGKSRNQAKAAAAPATDDGPRITERQARLLRKRLESNNITEADLLARYNVQQLEDLAGSLINDLMAFAEGKAKAAA